MDTRTVQKGMAALGEGRKFEAVGASVERGAAG
jgi:hypothetical protein